MTTTGPPGDFTQTGSRHIDFPGAKLRGTLVAMSSAAATQRMVVVVLSSRQSRRGSWGGPVLSTRGIGRRVFERLLGGLSVPDRYTRKRHGNAPKALRGARQFKQ